MVKIIAVVGLTGSGKSIVTDEFVKKDYVKVYFGGIVIDIIKKKGMEINEDNERKIREGLRTEHGMAAFAVVNLPKVQNPYNEGKNVIIDGLYSWSEYKFLKNKFGDNLITIAVYASPKTRHYRLSTRELRPLTNEKAKSRDYAEIENIEKGGPIVIADYTLVNEGTVDELIEQLNVIISKIE